MCTTCGCSGGETRIDGNRADAHGDAHGAIGGGVRAYAHAHRQGGVIAGALGAAHAPGVAPARIVQVEQDILAANAAYAAENRRFLAARGVFALNLLSSPGSGKTTLLVRTIEAWRNRAPVAVIEGDQQSSRDADRVRATGVPAVQINTGRGCHLDAHRVGHALERLQPVAGSLLLIENVGNLVCPAAFDLGEARKVVMLSVTEGDDKPLKYPDMFRVADLLVIGKSDLAPHVEFDVDAAIGYARRVRPGLAALVVSARTGAGLDRWLDWLERGLAQARLAARCA
jgi:hydrogenase nickel incorporation protein HypB